MDDDTLLGILLRGRPATVDDGEIVLVKVPGSFM